MQMQQAGEGARRSGASADRGASGAEPGRMAGKRKLASMCQDASEQIKFGAPGVNTARSAGQDRPGYSFAI